MEMVDYKCWYYETAKDCGREITRLLESHRIPEPETAKGCGAFFYSEKDT